MVGTQFKTRLHQTALIIPSVQHLLSSKGDILTGTLKHYGTATDGWLSFGDKDEGTVNATMEMLEHAYTFHVNYKGALQSQKVTVSGKTEVTFDTKAYKITQNVNSDAKVVIKLKPELPSAVQ